VLGSRLALALGTCASYGGIPAAPPNPTPQRWGCSAHGQHHGVGVSRASRDVHHRQAFPRSPILAEQTARLAIAMLVLDVESYLKISFNSIQVNTDSLAHFLASAHLSNSRLSGNFWLMRR
jgi:hypothetical protein